MSKWEKVKLGDIFKVMNNKSKQLPTTQYLNIGSFPIIDQSSDFICGYSDKKEKVIFDYLPLTIFGDHTRHVKFIDFPFIAGADGTQLLKPSNLFNDNFFYHLISFSANKIGNYGYDRHLKHLKEYIALYPTDKSIQTRIAEILSTADKAIEDSEKLIAKYKRMKTGMMQDLLTKGIDENGNIRSEATHKFKDSLLGRIPVEWEVKRLEEIIDINPKEDIKKLDKNMIVSFIKMEDISNEAELIRASERRLLDIKKGFKLFKENDILFAKITPCMENGKGAIISKLKNGLGLGSTEFYILRTKSIKSSLFIFYLTTQKSFRLKAKTFMTGSAGQQRVSRLFFKEYLIATPSLNEQDMIGEIILSLNKSIITETQTLSKLKRLKTGLMNDLLSRKVEVVDSE